MLLKAKAYPPPPLVRTKTEFRRCCGTPTRCAECQFPENREINRQFSKLPTISVRSVRFPVDLRCNPSALRMIPCSSLEQGIRVIEQGIHLSKHGILQFRLAHLAIQYRWLCFCQNDVIGADQFRTWHRSQGDRFLRSRNHLFHTTIVLFWQGNYASGNYAAAE